MPAETRPGVELPDSLPPIPADEFGPVFREPWEAQAFALVVALHKAGRFTWPEWVATISAEIREAQAAGDPDLGQTYYRHWVSALEKMAVAKALTGEAELRLRHLECRSNAQAMMHGHLAQRAPVHIDTQRREAE